jgi:WD40 repeat protein/tRNA A-37 threonylcarbamoyl transferase component Bud32
MVHATSCQQCGSTTESESLDGLCSRCLATVAFAPESPEETEVASAAQALAALNKTIVLDGSALVTETNPVGRFGDYELIAEIARGGMGVVYKARQLSLNRTVAVKMILHARFNNPEFVRRFRAEAEAAANLRHPNIVGIYEIGEHDGQHYFSMEYVEGYDLQFFVNEPLPPRCTAQHVKTIAEAIHYAHQHGILHRDLKPSNVLVDLNGEVRITDFGLAKRVPGTEASSIGSRPGSSALGGAGELDVTASGQILGSPGYMSPEQADGRSRDVDVRSDVYAVGAILYSLLTGRPPFIADTIEAALRQILQAEPVSLRLLNPRVPKDLETICLKCLQKEPNRRYASAQDVADELGRFLRNEPIRALPISAPAKVWRWCRRNPRLATVTVLAATALLVISIGSPIAAFRLNQLRLVAEEGELKARRNAYAADMAGVQDAIEHRNYGQALRLLASHRPAANQRDLRGWEFRHFWERCRSDELETLAKCETDIMAVCVSHDGKWIGARDRANYVHVWNADGKNEVLRLNNTGGHPIAPAFSPDDRTFALSLARSVKFWSVDTLREEPGSLEHPDSVRLVQFLSDGTLATVSGTNLYIWYVQTRSQREIHSIPKGNKFSLAADGKTLIVGVDDQRLALWEKGDGVVRSWSSGHVPGSNPIRMVLSPDAGTLVTGVALSAGGDFRIRVWDLATGTMATNLEAHRSYISSMTFSGTGDLLVTTSFDGTMELWNTRLWQRIAILKGHTSLVNSAAFLPGDSRLVSGSSDRTLKVWSTNPEHSPTSTLSLAPDLVNELVNGNLGALSVDASTAVMLTTNGTGILVDTRQPAVIAEMHLPLNDAMKVAVHRGTNGTLLALVRVGGIISLWDPVNQRHAGDLNVLNRQTTYALKFSRDGRRLAARSGGHTQLWDVASRSELPAWSNRLLPAADLQFSPDGRMLACGEENGTISFWDLETGRALFSLPGHSGRRINRIAFSSDGARLGSTGQDGTARAWDLRSRREIARVHGAKTSFYRVSFSPNGSRLCVSEYDNAVLFDIEANRQVARLKTYTPVFVDDDTVLGLSSTELWHWRPPSIAAIDAAPTNALVKEGPDH